MYKANYVEEILELREEIQYLREENARLREEARKHLDFVIESNRSSETALTGWIGLLMDGSLSLPGGRTEEKS